MDPLTYALNLVSIYAILFSVKRERTVLFSVKRDLIVDPHLPP